MKNQNFLHILHICAEQNQDNFYYLNYREKQNDQHRKPLSEHSYLKRKNHVRRSHYNRRKNDGNFTR